MGQVVSRKAAAAQKPNFRSCRGGAPCPPARKSGFAIGYGEKQNYGFITDTSCFHSAPCSGGRRDPPLRGSAKFELLSQPKSGGNSSGRGNVAQRQRGSGFRESALAVYAASVSARASPRPTVFIFCFYAAVQKSSLRHDIFTFSKFHAFLFFILYYII